MSQVHFEIFRRQGARGGWTLHEVVSARQSALDMATALMAAQQATGVKVVKETYDDATGQYRTLKIFEDGHNQMKVEPVAEEAPKALPCFKPDDLYSYHARATIARLLTEYLAREKLTVTELIHRADALEKLEATGTLYQHAIQKVAVAQASATTMPVVQIVKNLNELVTSAIHQVHRDARRNIFPKTPAGQFGALATALGGDNHYLFNGALAQHLADANGWDQKLARLLAVMADAPADEKPRALLLSAVDAIIAEILNGSAALQDMMGARDHLGAALLALVDLFIGKKASGAAGTGIEKLAERFARDELPEARSAIANRIIAELQSTRRLCPGPIVDELKLLRAVANELVMAQGKYLAHEDIIAVFTLRSRRLISHEAVHEHLAGAATPDEKVERLLVVEENIIGQENKRNLGAFVVPIVTSAAFETRFLQGKATPMARLARLAELQGRVRRSAFQDIQRRNICEILDKFACQIEAKAKLFETVGARSPAPVERVAAMVQLFTSNLVTEGAMAERGRQIILACLGKPGFLSSYAAQVPRAADGAAASLDEARRTLTDVLKKVGITTETGLGSIAA